MTRVFLRHTLAALAFLLALPLAAQDAPGEPPVTLLADKISTDRDGVLVAEGNVEVFTGNRRLTSPRIVYDQNADLVTIDGPVRLSEGGEILILADSAQLDADLRQGILESARAVFNERSQIAASRIERRSPQVTEYSNTVTTSCQVCVPGRPPLWQIRAKRAVRDQRRERIYFEHPQFRVAGVPVFYLPAISIPDFGVDRARGFLPPIGETSSLLGDGIKTPYFIPLGQSADLLLTPYATNRDAKALIGRYRQQYHNGQITVNSAVAQDQLLPDEMRSYVFLAGNFNLENDIKLKFDLEATSDDDFLSDYDFSSKTRLDSAISLSQVKTHRRAEAELIHYTSLRVDDENDTLPTRVGDARLDQRWQIGDSGGFLDMNLRAHFHTRTSDEDIIGRDMSHGRAHLRYSQHWVTAPGIRFGLDGRLMGDIRNIEQDSRYPSYQEALTPGLAFSASMPFSRTEASGAIQYLEPVMQTVWVEEYGIQTPNDDSNQPAFDSGNLFSFNRYPELDRLEVGLRTNLGLRWRRVSANGTALELLAGRVYRFNNTDQFSPGTGLAGYRSDWLIETGLKLPRNLQATNRVLLTDNGDTTVSETRFAWNSARFDLGLQHTWQIPDSEMNLTEPINEILTFASWDMTERWSMAARARYDLHDDSPVRTDLDLRYSGNCVRVDLSAGQRFTNQGEEVTSYGISISLAGLGVSQTATGRSNRCFAD
ncbi:MAG: LPS-assembly protein LptD [Mangrovicoccus sp.]